MKGKINVRVENKRIIYQFAIKRNITIIRGESATGKTTLIGMLQSYEHDQEESGISVRCSKKCVVLTDLRWQENLNAIRDSIIFIDEDYHFIRSEKFAAAIRATDNYYVLVTRDNLSNLPYSVDEIYGIRVSGKYSDLKKTYNEFYHIYGEPALHEKSRSRCVVTEDSNAGNDFFRAVCGKEQLCLSAQGKSKIYAFVKKNTDKLCLVIADGAAFGPEMEKMDEMIRAGYKLALYLPESFEWLILKSGILKDRETEDILERPEEFIESAKYFSWERFFTALLTEKSRGTVYRYSKASLNQVYLHENEKNAILAVMPENVRKFITEED